MFGSTRHGHRYHGAPVLTPLSERSSEFVYFHPISCNENAHSRTSGQISCQTAGGVYLYRSREEAEKIYTEDWRAFIVEKYGVEPSVHYFATQVVVDNVIGEIITDAWRANLVERRMRIVWAGGTDKLEGIRK